MSKRTYDYYSESQTNEFDRNYLLLLYGHQWDPHHVASIGLVPSTTTLRKIPIKYQPLYRMELQHLQYTVKKLALLGLDIFKHTLSFLSDFDLVEYEAYWDQDGISNVATELLNKRVSISDGENIMESDSE